MPVAKFIQQLRHTPETIEFDDTINVIDAHFRFTPTRFRNGDLVNATGQNSGSCKLLAFARLHNLSVTETLFCFGAFYRNDVKQNPQGSDHQNIRNFIRYGWEGVAFDGEPLTQR